MSARAKRGSVDGEVVAAAVGASVGTIVRAEWGSVDGDIVAAAVGASVGTIVRDELNGAAWMERSLLRLWELRSAT